MSLIDPSSQISTSGPRQEVLEDRALLPLDLLALLDPLSPAGAVVGARELEPVPRLQLDRALADEELLVLRIPVAEVSHAGPLLASRPHEVQDPRTSGRPAARR